MGKWKKAVAALAAVPMLMALAPAANAVESDPTDSSGADQRYFPGGFNLSNT